MVVSSHQSCLYYQVSHRLGPLLYIIFINDVAIQISPESPLSLFADDMILYRHILSGVDHYILQCYIFMVNGLSFQPAKCCSMLITRKKNHAVPPIIFVGNFLLDKVTYVNILVCRSTQTCHGQLI